MNASMHCSALPMHALDLHNRAGDMGIQHNVDKNDPKSVTELQT